MEQRPPVLITLEHKGHYYRVKQQSKDRTLVKPGLLVEQKNGNQEDAAKQETKLEFPESLKDARRDQDDKDRAEGAASGDRR